MLFRSLHLGETLANDVVQGAQAAASEIENLTQQTFELTKQTEKNYFNWAFIWGGINQATGQGPGLGPANQLLQWSLKASLNMPFTRQDLMGAITTLSVMGGMDPSQVEHDLTLLSDVASTQGRPGLTLSWAAMAALRGGQGYGRMLLMDLNLSKNTLAKFGYDEKNPATFFPALQGYEQSRGEYGASAYVSQNTFWGAWTSFQDRLQNFGLAVGGWNNNPSRLTDDVTKGSFFAAIKSDLFDTNKALDQLANSGAIQHLADLFGSVLGGGVNDARIALEGLIGGLQHSGLGDFLFGTPTTVTNRKTGKQTHTYSGGLFGDLGNTLGSPQFQAALSQIGQILGGVIGPAMKDLALGAEAFVGALGGSGVGSDILQKLSEVGQWLGSPSTQQGIQQLATAFGTLAGKGVEGAIGAAQSFIQGLGAGGAGAGFMQSLQGLAQWFSDPQHQADIKAVAYVIGVDFGGMVMSAVDGVKTLLDLLGGFTAELSDIAQVLNDVAHGDYADAWTAGQKFLSDSHNTLATFFGDMQNWGNQYATTFAALTNQPNFGGGGAAGGAATAGKALADAIVRAMTARLSGAQTGDEIAAAIAHSIATQLGKGSSAAKAAASLGAAIAQQIAESIAAELGKEAFSAYLTTRQPGGALTTISFGVR